MAWSAHVSISGGADGDPAIQLVAADPGGILEVNLVNATGAARAWAWSTDPSAPPTRKQVFDNGSPIGTLGSPLSPYIGSDANPVNPSRIFVAVEGDSTSSAKIVAWD